MQHNAIVGRLLTQPQLIQRDDTQYSLFTVAELRNRGDQQTKLEFIAYDNVAERIADRYLVGDTMSVDFIIKNSKYEKDGTDIHGYSFVAINAEYIAPGKKRRELNNNQAPHQ
ncbi:MAG: hypothetical protein ACRDCA_03620 [Serratia sp. (in: enterobacteria)]|uniref:hypothetical protein n=1 Tax=Serratia sp. (in: enterobacteria) TaxID=616 RepID=UPI003F35E6E4